MLRPGYPLVTSRLVLRPFDSGDLEQLFAFHSLPEVARFLYWEARDLEQVGGVLEAKRGQAALEEEQVLALAVVGRAEGVVVGEVSLHWLHRMIGRCDALNLPSARLLERLGMRREAYFLHNEHFKGRWGDELVYALLEDEWRARVSGARPG